jgi:electron transfer flavoprotein alpha subunit
MTRSRRDPRAEHEARRVAGGARSRFTIEAAAAPSSGRKRIDPRKAEAGLLVSAARKRLDRSQTGGASHGTITVAAPEAPKLIVIDQPAYLVAVVPDALDGRLSPTDRQLFGAARILADAGGGAVLAIAPLTEEIGSAGADRLATYALPDRAYDPEGRAAAIAVAIRAYEPCHVIFPETADGGDLARRVAVLLAEPLFPDVEAISAKQIIRPARAGAREQRQAPGRLIGLAPDVVAAYAGLPREARPLDPVASPELSRGIQASRRVPGDPAAIPLAEADFIVAAGNGVSDFEEFHRLVAALGASPGASRVVCDAGLMPRDRQVGASGTVLSGTAYVALGIAGAPQHLEGVARIEHVVAVNTDLHAAMVARAGLSIIADAQKVMPALIEALKGRAAP